MQFIRIKMCIEGVKSILGDWTMRNMLAYELIIHILQCELTGDKESLIVRIHTMKIADIQS